MVLLKPAHDIKVGHESLMDFHSGRVLCKLTRIFHTVDEKTCKTVIETNPTKLTKGQAAFCEFEVKDTCARPLHCEPAAHCESLARFQWVHNGTVVGLGCVVSVVRVVPTPRPACIVDAKLVKRNRSIVVRAQLCDFASVRYGEPSRETGAVGDDKETREEPKLADAWKA